jgi:hypothetical protein
MAISLILLGLATGQQAKPEKFSLDSFLDDQTLFVARLKVLALDADKLAEQFFLATKGHSPKSETEQGQVKNNQTMFKTWQSQFEKAGGREIYLVYSLTDVSSPFLVVPVAPQNDIKALTQLLANGKAGGSENSETSFWLMKGQQAHAALIGQALVFDSKPTAERFQSNAGSGKRPELVSLLDKAGEGQIQLALASTADGRKVLEEIMPRLPRELGGGPITQLTRGVQRLSASVTFTPSLKARLLVQSEDVNAANGAKALWQSFVNTLVTEMQKNHSEMIEPVKTLSLEVQDAQVSLNISHEQAEKLLTSMGVAWWKNRRGPLRASSIRQLIIAMHNYHSDYGYLPPQAICDKTGKPLLSWRISLLPYLEQEALYKQFKLDEPWDSEHNKTLLEKLPEVYQHPDPEVKSPPGMTYFKVFYSKKGMKPAAALLEQGKVSLGMITVQDGTSNTALLTDAGPAVPWTKPADILFDPNQPLPKLASPGKDDKFWIGFCDGSVSAIANDIKPELLRAFVTRNGGEKVSLDKTRYK